MQAGANSGFIPQENRPQLGLSARVKGRSEEQLYENSPRLNRKSPLVANEQNVVALVTDYGF
jgi:hypothetical protein